MSASTSPAGRIIIDLFSTLDGVAQAPGGPEEDQSDGFRFGGWQAPFQDETVGRIVVDGILQTDALLLGRRTYDIFADYWPQHDDVIGTRFNAIPKYVASRDHAIRLDWEGSSRVGDDLVAEIDALRKQHRETHVIGSLDLTRTLFAEHLFDELRLWVYPVVLGEGHRVFPEGSTPANLALVAPPVATECGAILLRYAPRPGVPETGIMGAPDASDEPE